jgi:hypothetical protein
MSSASSARGLVQAFAEGRATPERAVAAVAAAYYARPAAAPAALRELIGIVERAAPGMVELAAREGGPGFDVRPVGRPFPAAAEAELRQAAAALLATEWGRRPGMEAAAAAIGVAAGAGGGTGWCALCGLFSAAS